MNGKSSTAKKVLRKRAKSGTEEPLYITQRGVNRCAIVLDDDDRRQYLPTPH
jgi:hypothetical protein